MNMNHSDFFDFLQSKEVLPNNYELSQSFESIINGPDCELKEMLHLHLFTEQLENVEKQGLEDEIFI